MRDPNKRTRKVKHRLERRNQRSNDKLSFERAGEGGVVKGTFVDNEIFLNSDFCVLNVIKSWLSAKIGYEIHYIN